MAVRVMLVGNQDLTRYGLRAALQYEPDIAVVGEARSGRDALDGTLTLHPDIVLMDAPMSDGDDATTIQAINQSCPQTHVLVLTAAPSQEHFRRAMTAGAAGYELMNISPSHLANAIRAVHKGKTAINQTVIKQIAESFAGDNHEPAPGGERPRGLTSRETEVLAKVAQGLSDKEIAAKLYLSESTVKSHLRVIYTKLNIHNRAQATAFAVQRGLLDPP